VYLPQKYRAIIRHGDAKRPGKACAIKATQYLVRQGCSDEEVRTWHFSTKNHGFDWVRRQPDPEAASAELVAMVDRNRKPVLSTKQRFQKIKATLAMGEVISQSALINAVDNPNKSYTKADIRALAAMGKVHMVPEQHGQVTWWLIALADEADNVMETYAPYVAELTATIAKRKIRDQYVWLRMKRSAKAYCAANPIQPTPQLDLASFL
jgi:hypothetical protein